MTAKPCHPTTRIVMQNLKAYRKAAGLSVEKLCQLMTESGVPIKRPVLANFESGRRSNITIAEVAAAAGVLQIPITSLLDENGPCPTCHGNPPLGFTCRKCGNEGASAC